MIRNRTRKRESLPALRRHFRAALVAANSAEYRDKLDEADGLRSIASRIRADVAARFGVDLSDELRKRG